MHAHALLVGLQFIDMPNEQEEERFGFSHLHFAKAVELGLLSVLLNF